MNHRTAHTPRRSGTRRFAIALSAILVLLALFQLALVLGAPLGHFAWGGQHRVLPAGLRLGSVVSILVYGAIALIAWDRVGAVQVLPRRLSKVAIWVVFANFAIGVVVNAISRSQQERWVMAPVSLVLALLSFLIATRSDE